MTDQTLQLLLNRLDHLTVEFQELREGVLKAVRISDDDPEMALTRARKVLEYVVRDVFRLRCNEDPGTRPLENLLQRLNKDGHLPKRLSAYASYIRDLGNVGTHVYGEDLSKEDVRRSFENLTAILEWYFEQVRPDAFMKVETPAPVEEDARLRLEEEALRRGEQLAQELAREQEKTRRLQEEATRRRSEETERKRIEAEELKRLAEAEENARTKMKEAAQTTSSAAGESAGRYVQPQEGKDQSIARPSLPPTSSRIKAAGILCLIGAVLLFLAGAGGLKAIVLFFIGLLLIGIHIGRGLSRKAVHAAGPAPLPSPAHNPSPSPAASELGIAIPGALSGTMGKMIISAILGLVAGAIAAPILSFPLDGDVVRSALLVGVVHGLVTGFILIPISEALPRRVHTLLVGIVIGIIVGLSIRAIISALFLVGRSDWYSVRDGQTLEIIGGGILGLFLGAIHGSKRTVR